MREDKLNKLALTLKENRTASEIRFAEYLKSIGVRFEEQKVICGYIPDFYFPSHNKKIIELDGKFHLGQESRDAQRDLRLLKQGYRVLRLPSSAVFRRFAWLVNEVSVFLNTPLPVPCGKHRKSKKKPKRLVHRRKAKIVRLTKQGLPKQRQW